MVLAEDEPSLCQFLGELLEGEYAVETAMDGEQAWQAIEQEQPHLVLSNVDMPVLDGIGLLQRMRGSPATAAVPVLLISARVNTVGLEKGSTDSANGWVQKPFKLADFLSQVRALCPSPSASAIEASQD